MGSTVDVEDVVIGSGPTGFAAALGVVQAGRRPLIVDCGQSPQFAAPRYSRSSVLALKGDPSREAVFAYPRSLVASADGKQLPLSSARGGLARIWGAGVLARRAVEMSELGPVAEEVEASYSALFAQLSVAGCQDALSRRFPWPPGTPAAPQSQRYSQIVSNAAAGNGDVLVGASRVALDAQRCVKKGACLDGCPLGLFFSADRALATMASSHQCGFADGPVIRIDRKSGRLFLTLPSATIRASRVFLAAGPIGTPALLQRSGLAPTTLRVADSAVFYMGFINRVAAAGDEGEYAAAQAAAYSSVPGERDFQLSLYESNEYYLSALRKLMPAAAGLEQLVKPLLARFNAGIGFLDSSVSGALVLQYSNGRTYVRRQNADVRRHVLAVIGRLRRAFRSTGLTPLPSLALIPPAGCGYHSGSGIPMNSDLLGFDGRLKADRDIYVVDASALPKVWAGSHTFTAMANAYRIARASG